MAHCPPAVCAEQSPATAGDQVGDVGDEGCLSPILAFTTIQLFYNGRYTLTARYIIAKTIAQKKLRATLGK